MFSFGHCPNYLSPPPPLLSGNLYIFFGRHKGIYKVYFLIRARPSPPLIRAMPERKHFFPRGVPLQCKRFLKIYILPDLDQLAVGVESFYSQISKTNYRYVLPTNKYYQHSSVLIYIREDF